MEPRGRPRAVHLFDLGRLRNFSDCVFAVALTVLAVVAAVPPSDATASQVDEFLRGAAVRYGPFVGSFLAVGYLWLQHHRLYSVVRRADGRTVVANLAALGLVVLIPWLAQLGSAFAELRTPHLLFSSVLCLIGLVLLGTVHHLRRAGLFLPALDDEAVRVLWWRTAVLPVAWAGAFVLTLAGAGWVIAGWPLVIIGNLLVRRFVGGVDRAVRIDGSDGVSVEDEVVDPPRSSRQLPSIVRIMGFSDNVFAFGVTALVFQLQVPNRVAVNEAQLLRYLGAELDPNLTGYLLGFVVMGLLWMLHVSHFALIERHGRRLAAWNLVHLMAIAVLPFATLLYSDVRYNTTTTIYAVTAALAGAAAAAVWTYVVGGHLQLDWLTPAELRGIAARTWAVPLAFAASLPFAILVPVAAPAVWVGVAAVTVLRYPARDGTEDELRRSLAATE